MASLGWWGCSYIAATIWLVNACNNNNNWLPFDIICISNRTIKRDIITGRWGSRPVTPWRQPLSGASSLQRRENRRYRWWRQWWWNIVSNTTRVSTTEQCTNHSCSVNSLMQKIVKIATFLGKYKSSKVVDTEQSLDWGLSICNHPHNYCLIHLSQLMHVGYCITQKRKNKKILQRIKIIKTVTFSQR